MDPDAIPRFEAWRKDMEMVLACLLDHYLSDYEQNDGETNEGLRDALCAEAEKLVPNWRERRDEWQPKRQ